jgi:DNA-3-methyladenine glycosylase I
MTPRPAWCVYVLECSDRSLYTGIAKDPQKRLAEHLAGKGSRFVRSHRPARLVYREGCATLSQALRREAEIKSWPRARKAELVARFRKGGGRVKIAAMPEKPRSGSCEWPAADPLMIAYHDREWGVPLYDDRRIFEFLILETMQAGLSWRCVLHKRENFRRAFDGFDPEKVARYGAAKIKKLLLDPGIIRNRLKIESAVSNARAFLDQQQRSNGFHKYIWQFTDGKPLVNRRKSLKDIPAVTPESDRMSRALKEKGFKFVGSTVCYAHMQATGMVNDHLIGCFRHAQCIEKGRL